MKISSSIFSLLLIALVALPVTNSEASKAEGNQVCSNESSFLKKRLATNQVDDICKLYAGKVMLIVNTASKCGFTYQYEGLEALHARYQEDGLVVVGFPSNDFGGQEPGSEEQIRDFCVNTYAIKFPMYQKTRVKGPDADPLYRTLIEASGSAPRWNFHKYVVDRKGRVVEAFGSSTKPSSDKLIDLIESLLQDKVADRQTTNDRIVPVVSHLTQER